MFLASSSNDVIHKMRNGSHRSRYAPLDDFTIAKLNHIYHNAPYVYSFILKADSQLLSETVAYPSLGITSSKN